MTPFLIMLLAQSAKSRGFGGSAPNGRRLRLRDHLSLYSGRPPSQTTSLRAGKCSALTKGNHLRSSCIVAAP